MAKFKVGDEVWWFNYPYRDEFDFEFNAIQLKNGKYGDDFVPEEHLYSTKRAALNTMAKKLKEFVDHEEVNQD
jgi:hypothetical protein